MPVQAPLVTAIGSMRYASTVRAAIRYHGHWPNLDYYHHLAFGTRRIAVQMISGKIEQLKIIVQNLIDEDEGSPASQFLKHIVGSLEVCVDTAYRNLQVAGREAYKKELESDYAFWTQCGGLGGKGYCKTVGQVTDKQFQSSYDDAYKLLKEMIGKEWEKLIDILDGMLKEKGGEVGVALKRK